LNLSYLQFKVPKMPGIRHVSVTSYDIPLLITGEVKIAEQ